MQKRILVTILCAVASIAALTSSHGQTREPALPPVREQARIQQEWLKERLDTVLPALMRKHDVAMWLVICREYNEDPVFKSLVSPTVFAARRRTILVFNDPGQGRPLERLALGGGSNDGLYQVYRDQQVENRELWGEGQWALLKKLIEDRDPKNIAVNISATHAFSDGLSAGEWEQVQKTLGPKYIGRVIRAELLPVEYIATRVPGMLQHYRGFTETVHSLLQRGFSSEVITPGKTTNLDVVWWLRQRVADQGFGTWFQPTVRVQRKGRPDVGNLAEDSGVIIQRGDVLHVDFGLVGMGLATDTQHMGYVLRDGETEVPAGIQKALANTNRMQDLLLARMKAGRTGNEVLADTLAAMREEKIKGTIYTHPIGDHGHGAGPLVGLWDRQEGVPGRGDVKIIPNMWFSIELGGRTLVPEWDNQELFVGQEEDAAIDKDGNISWVLRRQTRYHLVK